MYQQEGITAASQNTLDRETCEYMNRAISVFKQME